MNKKQRLIMFAVGAVMLILVFLIFYKNENPVKTLSATPESKLPVIVIDPGHGGFDGGAVGCDGTVEKEINLSVSKKLADILHLTGFEVVMTRDSDVSTCDDPSASIRNKKASDLHNRMKIMRNTPNNLFISIHQNHFSEEKYHGAQIFFSPNNEESPLLASEIQEAVVKNMQPDNKRQTKPSTKSIYLLYEAKSTAVMVECGFLSNRQEVKKLNDGNYQKELSFSVSEGLFTYLQILK